jgi:hypothetical protein
MWEFQLIREWIVAVFKHTSAPIWIVGDWFGSLAPSSEPMERFGEAVDQLMPYLSGIEHHASTGQSVMTINPPPAIAECLQMNQLTDPTFEKAVDNVISKAFTPVALLFRKVFGCAHLEDRVDLLLRATESAIAFFALVLIAEHESTAQVGDSSERERIERAKARAFASPPMFGSWESLLNAFFKQGFAGLATHIEQNLSASASPECQKLREMLETLGGENSVRDVSKAIRTQQNTLTLLRSVRNVTTAHGPVTEHMSPELYCSILAVVLDFLVALPWNSATLRHQGACLTIFRGSVPEICRETKNEAGNNLHILIQEGVSGSTAYEIDVSKYFRVPIGSQSIALYIGEKNAGRQAFLDPVSGVRFLGVR